MDTGGLAQMTYNHNNGLGGLGFPSSGYGSRGKGDNIKKLSVPSPSGNSTMNENQPAPRTSRSHLLAGLRTAPKSAGLPTSAPPTQLEQPIPNGSQPMPRSYPQAPPKTATGMAFPGSPLHPQQLQQQQQQQKRSQFPQIYSPDQILAPPSIQIGDGDDSQMDPRVYDELMRTNQYLAQQQMRLQQQLINVTAAAQQFQSMNMGPVHQESYTSNPMSFYNQQLQQGVQPIVQPIPNSPGMFTVYNPLTGQTTMAYDQNAAQQGYDSQQTPTANTFRRRVSPPPHSPSPVNRATNWRSGSPPKASGSPPRDDLMPQPPHSATAGTFRAAGRKNNLASINVDGPKTAGFKSAFPRTPMAGGFGPGQAQEGEHPVRQPRGPPAMEELIAKPTTKYEGSRNFASRQRRGALKNLVRAGIERRGVRSSAQSSESGGSPTSDAPLSVASDADDVSVRSGSASLAGRSDFEYPRSPNPGVIGGERFKERSRETSADSAYRSKMY